VRHQPGERGIAVELRHHAERPGQARAGRLDHAHRDRAVFAVRRQRPLLEQLIDLLDEAQLLLQRQVARQLVAPVGDLERRAGLGAASAVIRSRRLLNALKSPDSTSTAPTRSIGACAASGGASKSTRAASIRFSSSAPVPASGLRYGLTARVATTFCSDSAHTVQC